MDWKVWLDIAGVAFPVAVLIYNAGSQGRRLKHLEEDFKDCRKHREKCEGAWRRSDDALHTRVTRVQTEVSNLRGRMNGHAGV